MIFKNGKRIDGCSDTVPIGSINPYIGAAAPFGYLLCQGQMVSKTLYPELYEICGEIFGPSTSTEFKLPDLRGVTIAGYKENDSTFGTLGAIIGGLTHVHTTGDCTLTIDQIPAHKHGFSVSVNNGGNHNHGGATGNGGNHNHGGATGGAGGHSHTTGTQEMSNKGAPSWSGLRPYGYSSAGDVQNGSAVGDHTHGIGYSGEHSHSIGDSGNHSHGVTKSMDNAGGSGAHNHGNTGSASNIQPTIVMNWIVKAIMLVPNQSIVVGTRDTSDSNVYSTKYINNNYYTKGEIGNLSKNITLIAVTDTAPQNFNAGDKYFNTSTKKIYTAENNSWGNPEDPSDNALYIVFDTQNMYAYDGDTLVSVGGGTEGLADLIVVGDTPEETTKLLIEESDLDFQGGIEISDEYTTGDNVAYSADYINDLNKTMFNFAHPIGSYYETSDSSWTPSNAGWYGTWVQDSDSLKDVVANCSYSHGSISGNNNIQSVERTGTSTWTVTFTNAMADTNYIPLLSAERSGLGTEIIGVYGKTVNHFIFDMVNYNGGTYTDNDMDLNIFVYGQLATPKKRKWHRTA